MLTSIRQYKEPNIFLSLANNMKDCQFAGQQLDCIVGFLAFTKNSIKGLAFGELG
jgi:hypothetical protein